MPQVIDAVGVEEEVALGRVGRRLQLVDEVRQPLGQRLERPDLLRPAEGIIGVSGGRIVAVLEDVRGDAVPGEVLIEGAGREDVGRGQPLGLSVSRCLSPAKQNGSGR